jgi:pSer/pThr/pTyr-binding forkhead associated (FHA) protein
MEKLVVLGDDGSSQEFELLLKRLSIGRDGTCDICLSDRSVSRHHATLMRVYQGFSIEDEQSTNGTRVNGNAVTKRFLKHGDLIEIGKYNLRYIAQRPMNLSDDPDRTVVLNPQSSGSGGYQSPGTPPLQPVTGDNSATLSDQNEPLPPKPPYEAPRHGTQHPALVESDTESCAKVRFLAGENTGQEQVIDRAFFSVGNPTGDLVLINQRQNGYYLLKVGGKNTPKINDHPIKAGGVVLSNGDHITLGELSLKFINSPK